MSQEYTGGSVSYYTVTIQRPTRKGREPYDAECNDIIEALGMSYAEGNAFKALWRRCAARNLGKSKAGYGSGLYDAEKVEFFGARLVAQDKAEVLARTVDRVHPKPGALYELDPLEDPNFARHLGNKKQAGE